MQSVTARRRPWWVRPGLDIVDGRLRIAGAGRRGAGPRARDAALRLRPDAVRRERAARSRPPWPRTGLPHRVRFALKANPAAGGPRGLPRARARPARRRASASMPARPARSSARSNAAGGPTRSATPGRTSPSATSTSCSRTAIHLNLDAISQIERYGRRAPGTADRHPGRPGRRRRLQRAPRVRRRPADEVRHRAGAPRRRDRGGAPPRADVDTVHFHAGSGWLADGLAGFERALVARGRRRSNAAGRRPSDRARSTSVAGSGAPARQDERPVDLDAYAAVAGAPPRSARRHRRVRARRPPRQGRGDPARRGRDRGGPPRASRSSASTSAGTSTARTSSTGSPRRSSSAGRPTRTGPTVVTVAGHINEAGDVFAEDYPMPPVEEGDMVAMLNAGGVPAGDEFDALPPADGERGLPGSLSSGVASGSMQAIISGPTACARRDRDHRTAVQPMRLVLPVLGTKRCRRQRSAPAARRDDHSGPPAPGARRAESSPRPIGRRARSRGGRQDVANPGDHQRVVAPFRLVVDGRVDDRPAGVDDETDRDRGAADRPARWWRGPPAGRARGSFAEGRRARARKASPPMMGPCPRSLAARLRRDPGRSVRARCSRRSEAGTRRALPGSSSADGRLEPGPRDTRRASVDGIARPPDSSGADGDPAASVTPPPSSSTPRPVDPPPRAQATHGSPTPSSYYA